MPAPTAAYIAAMGAGGAGSSGLSLAGVGSLLGGAGSLASAFGGGGNNPNLTKMRYFNQIEDRVADAKRAGVHPLFALGANVSPAMATGSPSGSAVGDALQGVGSAVRGYARDRTSQSQIKMAQHESASRVRVNETQAMLNEARSRSVIAEMQANPGILNTVERRTLDPSHSVNPDTGRLQWWVDATGKYHRVNQKVAPQEVLEKEFGESSELQGIARLIKGMYGYKGTGDNMPSLKEIYNLLTTE